MGGTWEKKKIRGIGQNASNIINDLVRKLIFLHTKIRRASAKVGGEVGGEEF